MRKKILPMLLLCGYLGLVNGHLAIIRQGQPAHVLPYPADLYSKTDQAALRQGIVFDTEHELTRLLEAFLS